MHAVTYAFFLPPFLPLLMRLFLPTAMVADGAAATRAAAKEDVPGPCAGFGPAGGRELRGRDKPLWFTGGQYVAY
jgi:hypothetical protein